MLGLLAYLLINQWCSATACTTTLQPCMCHCVLQMCTLQRCYVARQLIRFNRELSTAACQRL